MTTHLTRALELYQRILADVAALHQPCQIRECVEAGGHCITCRDTDWPCSTRRLIAPLTGIGERAIEGAA